MIPVMLASLKPPRSLRLGVGDALGGAITGRDRDRSLHGRVVELDRLHQNGDRSSTSGCTCRTACCTSADGPVGSPEASGVDRPSFQPWGPEKSTSFRAASEA